jgi:hypothetical protein
VNESVTIVTSPAPRRPRVLGLGERLLGVVAAVAARWAGLFGLAGGLAAGWLLLPALLYSQQPQPLAFNHAVHTVDEGMACADCHAFRSDGSFVGVPAVAVCADCHAEALGDTPAEKRLVEHFVATGREVPWLVDARQPQNVLFSHAAHVRLAEISCDRCHGPRGFSTTPPVHEVNRISTYSRSIWGPRIAGGGAEPWHSMKMSDCSSCHAARGVRDHCLMCHR